MARIAILLALGALLVFGCTTTDQVDDAIMGGGMTVGGEMMPDDGMEAAVHAHGDDSLGEDRGDGETSSQSEGAPMDIAVYRNLAGEIEDPVFGIITSPETAVGYQDYEGMRYYFSCIGCKLKFAANPEKYAKK